MNQNCNNNGYEILDSGSMSCQQRYPLTNAPGSELQNMNYKDWVGMCTDGTSVYFGAGYNASISDAVITGLSVTSYLLSLAPPPVGPILSAAAGILSTLLGLLWPSGTQSTWHAFMIAVEQLVKQEISAYARGVAIRKLEGLQEALELYTTSAQAWENDKKNPLAQERVRTYFRAVLLDFVGAMPEFKVAGYEVPMLAMYAQAAELHLLLLRDGVLFGAGWELPRAEIDYLYILLQTKIKEYTDYCVNTYNKGLDEAKKQIGKLNPKDYNQYPYLNPYSGGGYSAEYKDETYYYEQVLNWNVMNDFRRDMTIIVLDLVAIWPTYDPMLYPNPNGTAAQLSREVYSTAYGKVGEKHENWEFIENRFVRPPHLVTRLSNLAISMADRPSPLDPIQYVGVKNRLSHIGSSTTWEEGFSTNYPSKGTQNVAGDIVGGLIAKVSSVPCNLQFLNFSGGQFQSVGQCPDPKLNAYYPRISTLNESIGTPPSNDSKASHRLSYVNAIGAKVINYPSYKVNFAGLASWGFGWVHNSLTPENTIVSDKTTQIPAVKAFQITNNASVVRGPGSTGGDLIRLAATTSGNRQLWIKVKPTLTALRRSYQVRIRYAAAANATLTVQKCVTNVACWETATKSVTATYSGALTYNAFKYENIFTIPANESEFSLEFLSTSGGPIYIDKIEFIPLNPIGEDVFEGVYRIVTALNNSSVINLNTSSRNLVIWDNNGSDVQQWRFLYHSSQRAVQMHSMWSNNYVISWDVGSDIAYGGVNQYRPDQYWIVEDAGNGYVYLRNKSNPNKVLDILNSGTANATRVRVNDFYSGTNQKFKLVKLS
ncbi:insecticidal delta-endotoxin Cry8Ea1 family protein [Bacillus cereus group sp. IBL03679]|uniref:insecticidal delta-endotoxin Cry8Ea1 family protein n=1 Tax=Bacillus cereus group sp. IBL03679 TaxID=3240095 RepID=UPI003D2F5F5B